MYIDYKNQLEEPVVCPICNEWYELQDSKQSKYNALALVCPDCYEAEDPDLEDIFTEDLEYLEHQCCEHIVASTGEVCGNKAKGLVRFVNGKNEVEDRPICKLHFRVFTEDLDKREIVYKAELL